MKGRSAAAVDTPQIEDRDGVAGSAAACYRLEPVGLAFASPRCKPARHQHEHLMTNGLRLAKPAAGRTCAARFDRCMIRFATVKSRLRTAASCKRYCPFGGWSQDELLQQWQSRWGSTRARELSDNRGRPARLTRRRETCRTRKSAPARCCGRRATASSCRPGISSSSHAHRRAARRMP